MKDIKNKNLITIRDLEFLFELKILNFCDNAQNVQLISNNLLIIT